MFTRRSFVAAAAAAVRSQPVDLFFAGENGVHTYRIPALIETRKGTLLAVADARFDSSGDLPARIALVMRRSRDGGKTWTPIETLRKVNDGGGVGDASLLIDRRTGRVWCFHAYGPPGIGFPTAKAGEVTGASTLQVHAIHSGDDGVTWSAPVDLTPQIKRPEWKAMFATSGTHFQTSKGRYLLPLVVRDESDKVAARNAFSEDGGRTWHTGSVIGEGTDESKAIELPDGSILQNLRNGNRRAIARSYDGGVNFGPLTHDGALIDPGCNAGLARLPNGRFVFTNAASTKRENLTARMNDGRNWTQPRVIHPGPAAYSTVVPLRDGALGLLYECGGQSPYERISFFRWQPGR